MKKFDAIALATVERSSISDIQCVQVRRNSEHFWVMANVGR